MLPVQPKPSRVRPGKRLALSVPRFAARRLAVAFFAASLCAAVLRAAGPGQKEVSFFPDSSTEIPAAARQEAKPSAWRGAEVPPTAGMAVFAIQKSGVQWLGGPDGAARFDPAASHPWDRWQYFVGRAWLPDNHVVGIWVEPDGSAAWIRTRTGFSRVSWTSRTLRQKAEYFEKRIEERHVRWGLVANSALGVAGDLSSNQPRSNDNDGLWTAVYLASQVYRHAETRAPEALAKARRSLEALMRLEEITGISGFPARSFVSAAEPKPRDGEWHATADGKWLWKGDTSSDELVGHYYAYALYHDLAADKETKAAIRRTVVRITDHLIGHGFSLVDLDGKPTRWGQWSEDYFASPDGEGEGPLQSLELLSFLKTAWHITGDDKYQSVYAELVRKGYARNIGGYRVSTQPEHVNFSDDELAFLSWQPLMKYERDPALRKIYLEALARLMREVEPDQNPLWAYIGAGAGSPPCSGTWKVDSLRTLRRIPMALIGWTAKNSQRKDLRLRPYKDRFGRIQCETALPPDERSIAKWNTNPYVLDGGGSGHDEDDGAFFLLPYWMGRHGGWVKE